MVMYRLRFPRGGMRGSDAGVGALVIGCVHPSLALLIVPTLRVVRSD
jgi:hypothetical protein